MTSASEESTEHAECEPVQPSSRTALVELFEKHPLAILVCNSVGTILAANAAAGKLFGCPHTLLANTSLTALFPEEESTLQISGFINHLTTQPETAAELFLWIEGPPRRCLAMAGVNLAHDPEVQGYVITLHDLTEYAFSHEELQTQKNFLEAVVAAARDAIVAIDHEGRVTLWSAAAERLFGYTRDEAMGRDVHALLALPESLAAYKKAFPRFTRFGKGKPVGKISEFVTRTKSGRILPVELSLSSFRSPRDRWQAVAVIRDVRERKRSQDLITSQNELLNRLCEVSHLLVGKTDVVAMAQDAARSCVEVLGADLAWLGEAKEDGRVQLLAQWPPDHPYPRSISVRWDDTPLGCGPTGLAIRTREPCVIHAVQAQEEGRIWSLQFRRHRLRSSAAIPLVSGQYVFGALSLYSRKQRYFDSAKIRNITMFANLVAAALQNARAADELRRQLEFLKALHEVDTAITGNLDLEVVLRVLLDEAAAKLPADAADVFLLNPASQTLEWAAGRGLESSAARGVRIPLGKTPAGRAALERRLVVVEEADTASADTRVELLAKERILSLAAAPLLAKGEVVGVLEVFARRPRAFDQQSLQFLEALACQAAIAVENAALFANLQKATAELASAYDATIEGWSRAMDFRDKETEGHTKRVAELTVQLARRLGVPEEMMVHMRRGALLHDMGKLAVPDSILLKQGELSLEEWEIMQQHPAYAYQMLGDISYLRPALEIPYCHHERWDGSGYPRGLKGEEIPLSARIFAVADVWDALTSDRPYRPAWPQDKALEYIREQAGQQFDPQVVEAFLEVIREQHAGNDPSRRTIADQAG